MSRRNSGKNLTEYWAFVREEYAKESPGPINMNKLVDWAIEKQFVDVIPVDPKKDLIRQARRATRNSKIRDKQGRIVREMIPAKVPKQVDENGNILMFDIEYDHIHRMSADHALMAFDQLDESITNQKRAASRALGSFIDNNPNAKAKQLQFSFFDFIVDDDDDQEPQVQLIEETNMKKAS